MDIYGFLRHFYETFMFSNCLNSKKASIIHRYLVFPSFTKDIYGLPHYFYETFMFSNCFKSKKASIIHRYLVFSSFIRHFYETFYVFELFEKQNTHLSSIDILYLLILPWISMGFSGIFMKLFMFSNCLKSKTRIFHP